MMRADAGLHADQARRQVGKSRLDLATRPFSAESRSHHADRALRRGMSSCQYRCRSRRLRSRWIAETWRAPCLRCPGPASVTGGAGARPDHPISRYTMVACARTTVDYCGTLLNDFV